MKWEIVPEYDDLSERAAGRWLEAMVENPRLVLGLPTGRTPEGLYARVVLHAQAQSAEGETLRRCLPDLTTFNLDEYVGIPPDHPGSYRSYMHRHLFDHVNIPEHHIHLPDGSAANILARQPQLDLEEALILECLQYEEAIAKAGGLGLTFLGLGTNGHIGFNEPGAEFSSRTHVVQLHTSTQQTNAAVFAGGAVPKRAITMGIATILESDSIVLLASGSKKSEAVARLAAGEVAVDFPASALRAHSDVTVLVDRAAASLL